MESRNKEIIPENEYTEATDIDVTDVLSEDNEEKPSKNPIKRMKEGGMFTLSFKIIGWAFVASLFVYLLSRFIPVFAEYWTRYPAHWLRFLLAKLTGWFPFSLAECVLVCLPIIALAYIVASTVSTKRDESSKNFYRWIRPLVCFVLVILTLFFAAFGPAYGRYKLADNIGITQAKVSADELYDTAITVSTHANGVLKDIGFDTNGASVMPYSYYSLVEKVNDAFEKYAGSVNYISHFDSHPKAIALSEPMTYTHISGVYTFMTGESNVNTNYPDFLMPFTMAHEMAHQRGIAREDEANFVAFLVCIGSDDAYVRYSGYANMANYLNSALNKADKELYKTFYAQYLPKQMQGEFIAYSKLFDKYRESTASKVTGAVNNGFLQSQGQQAGTKSYGLVVDLAVAYYKD
jgi:hypothetical protein